MCSLLGALISSKKNDDAGRKSKEEMEGETVNNGCSIEAFHCGHLGSTSLLVV